MTTKYAQADSAAEARARVDQEGASGEQQHSGQAASAMLMCLTAASFAASALISLTLLWFSGRFVYRLLFG